MQTAQINLDTEGEKMFFLRYLQVSSVPPLILLQAVFLKMSKKRKKDSVCT